MRLVPLPNVLKNMGSSIERELLSGPYVNFTNKLRDLSGDSILELDIDFWQLNAFELSLFQGQNACMKIVQLTISKWIKPLEELIEEVHSMCVHLLEKLGDMSWNVVLSLPSLRIVGMQLQIKCTHT